MKCPKCEAPMPPTPHKNHHCYRCGAPHPAIAQNEAAQRLARLGGDSSNTAEVTFGAAFTSEPACKVSDPTTEAIKTITEERERLRRVERDLDGVRAQIEAAHRVLEKRGLAPADLITRLQVWTDTYQALADDRMRMHRELANAHARAQRLERDREDAIASARTAEREMNEHREARSTAEHEHNLANERIEAIENESSQRLYGNTQKILDGAGIGPGTVLERVRELAKLHKMEHEDRVTAHRALSVALESRDAADKREGRTQAALDKFLGAVADQTVQIMELRSALREVKPDHPMFNGSGSARAGDATPG